MQNCEQGLSLGYRIPCVAQTPFCRSVLPFWSIVATFTSILHRVLFCRSNDQPNDRPNNQPNDLTINHSAASMSDNCCIHGTSAPLWLDGLVVSINGQTLESEPSLTNTALAICICAMCVYRQNAKHWAEPRHQHIAFPLRLRLRVLADGVLRPGVAGEVGVFLFSATHRTAADPHTRRPNNNPQDA
jgi:hypothetical protein